ncbi:hypothetical protein PR048_014495, partial [Dryococelus australis]
MDENGCRLLSSMCLRQQILTKWGEYSSDVQFILQRSASRPQPGLTPTKSPPPDPAGPDRNKDIRKSLTFSGGHQGWSELRRRDNAALLKGLEVSETDCSHVHFHAGCAPCRRRAWSVPLVGMCPEGLWSWSSPKRWKTSRLLAGSLELLVDINGRGPSGDLLLTDMVREELVQKNREDKGNLSPCHQEGYKSPARREAPPYREPPSPTSPPPYRDPPPPTSSPSRGTPEHTDSSSSSSTGKGNFKRNLIKDFQQVGDSQSEGMLYSNQYRDLVRLINYQRQKLSVQQAELTKLFPMGLSSPARQLARPYVPVLPSSLFQPPQKITGEPYPLAVCIRLGLPVPLGITSPYFRPARTSPPLESTSQDLSRVVRPQQIKRVRGGATCVVCVQYDAEIVFWEGKTREQQLQIDFLSQEIARIEAISHGGEEQLRQLSSVEEESEIVRQQEKTLKSELTLLRSKLANCETELLQCKNKIRSGTKVRYGVANPRFWSPESAAWNRRYSVGQHSIKVLQPAASIISFRQPAPATPSSAKALLSKT